MAWLRLPPQGRDGTVAVLTAYGSSLRGIDGEPHRHPDAARRLLRPPGPAPVPARQRLTCPVFVSGPEFLPELREQRHRTLTLITTARGIGHARVTEMNEQVAANLDRMIGELETITENDQEEAAGAS